ncbi:MAG: sulfotransferase [Pirellulaceae bacterium]
MADQFFLIGPLRTGSSLLARCIDDHPYAICLCESEINRALIGDYFVALHFQRMLHHGLEPHAIVRLLDRRRQDDLRSWMQWYAAARPQLSRLYDKEIASVLGDKSPDLFRSRAIVEFLAPSYPLIYTVRDPRAIYQSILDNSNESQREERWKNLALNFLAWEPFLDRPNVLVVRYEDLVATPETVMRRVYEHVGLVYSPRFLEPFERKHPKRFLWQTSIDWATGIRRDFDATRADRWRETLSDADEMKVCNSDVVAHFMRRFGYR